MLNKINYLSISTQCATDYFKNKINGEIFYNTLTLNYSDKELFTKKPLEKPVFDNVDNYLVYDQSGVHELSNLLNWDQQPWYAFVSVKTNSIVDFQHFYLFKNTEFYSVHVSDRLKQLLMPYIGQITIDTTHLLNLPFFDTELLSGDELVFYIITTNDILNKELIKIRLETISNHIDDKCRFNLDNGIFYIYNNELLHITYTTEDKINIQKPKRIFGDIIIFDNNGQEYEFKKFEFERLKSQLADLELFNTTYAKVLFNYIKANIKTFNLDSDCIYYGYLNDEIIAEINKLGVYL